MPVAGRSGHNIAYSAKKDGGVREDLVALDAAAALDHNNKYSSKQASVDMQVGAASSPAAAPSSSSDRRASESATLLAKAAAAAGTSAKPSTSFSLSNASITNSGGNGHQQPESRYRHEHSTQGLLARTAPSSALGFYGSNAAGPAFQQQSHSMKRDAAAAMEVATSQASPALGGVSDASSKQMSSSNNKKKQKSSSSTKQTGKQALKEVVSDAPPIRQSAAMARDYSNTSNTSTRSLPARATRGSKRKYLEESSDIDAGDSLEEEYNLLKPPPPSKQKGKGREMTADEGNSTAPQSRSTSPEHALGSLSVNGTHNTTHPAHSGLSIRLKNGQATSTDSKAAKAKRKKKTRTEEAGDDLMSPPPWEGPGKDPPNPSVLKWYQAPTWANLDAVTHDQAKSEPMSEPEIAKTIDSAEPVIPVPDESPALTVTTSRATSSEINGKSNAIVSSRASISSEPRDKLLLPGLNDRSVSAIEGGDEVSMRSATSTAMPSPVDEIDKQLGEVKKSIPAASTKKRRGRPPKKRPGSETPAPMSEDAREPTSATPQSVNEPVFSGIKGRYHATLQRERALIEAGTHPLFLQALVDYDKIRQERIAALDTILRVKGEAIQKALEAREKSLWETWQDNRRKLWYEMALKYSKKRRLLAFEKDEMEAEAIDPSGLLGIGKAILWPDRDATCSSVNPPVVEPLIRVPITAKPPLKGRTRSSNKASNQVGEAVVAPINTKVIQGISSLSKDEIDLDLEVMGLSKHKLQDNWFHNAITEEEAAEIAAGREAVKTEADTTMRELSIEDEYLLPKMDPNAQLQASYPHPTSYDYTSWPPYPDPRYPAGPPYNPYYPVPPYPPNSSTGNSGFHFPTGRDSQQNAHQSGGVQKTFSFPKGTKDSFDGKGGRKDDAILIDDDETSLPGNGHSQAAEQRRGRDDKSRRVGNQSKRKESQHQPRESMTKIELLNPRALQEDYQHLRRYPDNAYRAEYDRHRRRMPGEQYPYVAPGQAGSPDPNFVASPPRGEHASFRERRTSSGERDPRYAGSPEHWAPPNASSRYRPYYDGTRLSGHMQEDPSASNGYPGEFYVDPWGRPVDPYLPPTYYHPAYTEQLPPDSHYSARGVLDHPPPPDGYREEQRSRYRQYSAQSDDPYHPAYVPYQYPHYPQQASSHDTRHPDRGSHTTSSRHLAKSPERERLAPPGYSSNYPAPHR